MKRNNKKGFTIVELVIVIAVIAILAAVMIPTFGGIISSANESSRDQKARNALTTYMTTASAEDLADGVNGVIIIDGSVYTVTNNNLVDIGSDNTKVTKPADATVLYCNATHTSTACTHCGATVSE